MLRLYYHPLSSFCHKVLIALYENDTPFTPNIIEFGNQAILDDFLKIWPIGRFPVLRDDARDWLVPESSIIIEYLDQHFSGKTRFLQADPDLARQTRMSDRFFDLYVNVPMQKIVTDKLRPAGQNDSFGVEQAQKQLHTALDMIEKDMAKKTWAMGETFSMADCAAAPGLFYANEVAPLNERYPNVFAYLQRLKQRPSYARVLQEAQPYFALFPA
jgi:glutathione S-transferase